MGTTLVGAINVLATYAVLFLMDRCGRRTLILWSSGVMFLSCVFIVMSLLGYLGNMTALLAVNVYVIFFEFGYVAVVGRSSAADVFLSLIYLKFTIVSSQPRTHSMVDCCRDVLWKICGCSDGCFFTGELGLQLCYRVSHTC